MRTIARLSRVFFKTLFLINFLVGLLVLFPFFYLALRSPKGFKIAIALKRFWARWILLVPGIFLEIEDRANLKTLAQPCIYCANHTSYLDIVISYLVIPHYYIFLGKIELLKAPLFNIFFTSGMDLTVDRKNRNAAHQAYLEVGKRLDQGESVFMFPEGTISSSGQLKVFKNGAFKMAIEKQIPIVPITFKNNWKLLQNGGFFKAYCSPGFARVVVHPPISTKGMTDEQIGDLRHQCRETIASELHCTNA